MTDYVSGYEGNGHGFQIKEAKSLALKLQNDANIVDGVIRWKSNDSVPFDDAVALAVHIGLPVDPAACTKARDESNAAFLAEYRKRPRRDSAEARFERRAAFGPGQTVVDVISGKKYRT